MKKGILLFATILLFFISCDTGTNDGTKTPNGDQEFNTIGVYKGVIAGDDSSGVYTVIISDEAINRSIVNGGEYKADITITVDGITINKVGVATATVLGTDISFSINFTLQIVSTDFDFIMNIDNNGDVIDVSLDSADANATEYAVIGEQVTETNTIELWEGTSTAPDEMINGVNHSLNAIWNFSKNGNEILGAYSYQIKNKTTGAVLDSGSTTFSGTLNGTDLSVEVIVNGNTITQTCTANFNGNIADGTWNNPAVPNFQNGTWSGTKTE